MKKLFICFIAIIPLFSCSQKSAVITMIDDVETFEKAILKEDVQLVDVRRTKEFENGHIANAKHINVLQKADFLKRINELDKNKPVYVYCHSGKRSNKAAILLEKNGFKQVFDFSPGYKGWSEKKSN